MQVAQLGAGNKIIAGSRFFGFDPVILRMVFRREHKIPYLNRNAKETGIEQPDLQIPIGGDWSVCLTIRPASWGGPGRFPSGARETARRATPLRVQKESSATCFPVAADALLTAFGDTGSARARDAATGPPELNYHRRVSRYHCESSTESPVCKRSLMTASQSHT